MGMKTVHVADAGTAAGVPDQIAEALLHDPFDDLRFGKPNVQDWLPGVAGWNNVLSKGSGSRAGLAGGSFSLRDAPTT